MLTEAQSWGIALACVMMAADMVVGFIVAAINKELSSTKMRNGLLHKVLMLILIFACLAIEIGISHTVALPYDVPTCEVVCSYIVIMELISVLENIAKGYPEMKDSALFRLFNLGDKSDGKDE
jgi:toxin secretion/phage lysis holin|nr:MAG TPA: holin [Bacteriophage sp.]